MKKFVEKFFKRKSSENKNENLIDTSLIEEAVAVLLLRAANIDGKKDAKEIDAIKEAFRRLFKDNGGSQNAQMESLISEFGQYGSVQHLCKAIAASSEGRHGRSNEKITKA